VLDRVLCPRLVGRDEQLFALEDALLAAHRGESRFVALGGEAGLGKTRLATELAKRAQRLGWEVLWGACSEAELSLPYLPLVEALGNFISKQDTDPLAKSLGAARRELAQLFPQLARDEPATPVGDPGQAKLRLFEAVVALLALAAQDQGVLLVVEDVHWADSATRELLDHLARRLSSTRSLLLLTYRSDELIRRHPLAPLLQTWRRSGVAEVVMLAALGQRQIAEMIGAILEDEEVNPEFRDLMYARSEGNPFVLEEMLKEALDHGELTRTAEGWRSPHELGIPETVRDTILLRLTRVDPAETEVLETAAVLGRTFDYTTLLAASRAPESSVQRALQVAIAQQLIEEVSGGQAIYRWRHALTQEAVGDDIVLPRKQAIHSHAADALLAAGSGSLPLARHLLAAGRFEEAVPACVAAADDAEASLAFADALELVDRALPHAHDPLERARLLSRMGRLLWMQGKASAAAEVLAEGVAGLEDASEHLEAARYRLVLGRCLWEQSLPGEGLEEFERARAILEQHGPSADLALAYLRLANSYMFDFDPRALEIARRAVEVGRAAGADFERVWATAFLALILFEEGQDSEARAQLDQAFEEATRRDYSYIVHNIAYNDAWTKLHTMTAGIAARLEALASGQVPASMTDMTRMTKSWALRASGDLFGALDAIEHADALATDTTEKIRWRTRVEYGEVLLELGRLADASAKLPEPSARADLQDVVYDAAPQIRIRLQTERLDEAVALAREVAERAEQFAPYDDALDVAVEALVAADLLDEAQAVVDAGRTHPSDAGSAFLDLAQGRILLEKGAPAAAASILEAVSRTANARGFRLVEWRARTLTAQALARTGRHEGAERELEEVAAGAGAAGAALIATQARAVADRFGLALRHIEAQATPAEPEILQPGERLVTSMFADVRGYTALTSKTAPADMHERITTLYRWAAKEVDRQHGFVDKFAGDAVMATFNATGTRLDHVKEALEAALALSGKAALLDLGIGVGISVGPAVVAPAPADGNISVLGETTNLAARLQTAAKTGEIVMSEEAHRRVAAWLEEHGLEAVPEVLELKGFDGPQPAWRLKTTANR
jgi:predicted ATPase/class 3 adenylate cyclase